MEYHSPSNNINCVRYWSRHPAALWGLLRSWNFPYSQLFLIRRHLLHPQPNSPVNRRGHKHLLYIPFLTFLRFSIYLQRFAFRVLSPERGSARNSHWCLRTAWFWPNHEFRAEDRIKYNPTERQRSKRLDWFLDDVLLGHVDRLVTLRR